MPIVLVCRYLTLSKVFTAMGVKGTVIRLLLDQVFLSFIYNSQTIIDICIASVLCLNHQVDYGLFSLLTLVDLGYSRMDCYLKTVVDG